MPARLAIPVCYLTERARFSSVFTFEGLNALAGPSVAADRIGDVVVPANFSAPTLSKISSSIAPIRLFGGFRRCSDADPISIDSVIAASKLERQHA